MNRSIILLSFLVLFALSAYSQDEDKCINIVDRTFEAINNKSSASINQYLSGNFKIADHSGEIAKKILEQLFSQLGETINTYEEKGRVKLEDGSLEIVFSVDYEKMGKKESVFTFNKYCELEELKLFQMEVKVLEEGSTKISKPIQQIIEVPFQKVRNLIAFEVFLNGKKRLFVLDSGSPKIVLNTKYVHGKKEIKTISSTKDVNNHYISGMDVTIVEHLNFNGIEIKEQEVLTTDLSHLEKSLGTEIYGLIGHEMIKEYDILLDYANQKLILIDPDVFETFKDENLVNRQIQRASFTMRGHIPVVEVQISDQKLNFGIDTGAEANLIDKDLFDDLQQHVSNVQEDNLIGGDVKYKQVISAHINTMKVSNKLYKNVYTVFTDIEYLNKGNMEKINGLIGYPILSEQKIIISYERMEILFIA